MSSTEPRDWVGVQKVKWHALVLLGAVTLSSACSDEGHYSLAWTIGGVSVRSPADCSRAGLGTVRVSAYDSSGARRVEVFPCYPPTQEGPGLPDGTYDIQVEGLDFNGQPFFTQDGSKQYAMAWIRQVQIKSGRTKTISVDLEPPPACMNRIDDDRDGLVDGADPDCWVRDATGEPVLDDQGRPTPDPDDPDEAQ